MKQSAIWLESEGDAWHRRNQGKSRYPDPVMEAIEANGIKPKTVLELGCGTGWRLKDINAKFGSYCYGIDASAEAIEAGKPWPENVVCFVGLAQENNIFISDLIIYAFVLYQVDRSDLFKAVYNADLSLQDGGHIIIHDFFKEPETFEIVDYKHDARLKTFKMNFASLWLAHPFYTLVDERFGPEQTVVSVLRKRVL